MTSMLASNLTILAPMLHLQIENFLTEEECDHIISISEPHMARSGVVRGFDLPPLGHALCACFVTYLLCWGKIVQAFDNDTYQQLW